MPREGENKSDRFKRIATKRTRRILNDLRLLGNCSNRNNYSYTDDEVRKIFSTIEKELKRVKALFTKQDGEFKL
ncbi:MAG: hypothetical protein ACTSRR_09295 [Candidatus Heimdallarchaeaceae archaeon]